MYCQCVRIGDEALISSGFLPSGNGAHTPGRLEQIGAFSFPGVVCKMANPQTDAALWSGVLSGNTRRSKRHTATRHSSKSEISTDRHLANHLAAMAASDSSPAWAGCHGYTDLLSPGSASRKLSARYCNSQVGHGETSGLMNRIAASSYPGCQHQGSGEGR